jgi:hypothetical protein
VLIRVECQRHETGGSQVAQLRFDAFFGAAETRQPDDEFASIEYSVAVSFASVTAAGAVRLRLAPKQRNMIKCGALQWVHNGLRHNVSRLASIRL